MNSNKDLHTSGLIPINKPRGISSKDISRILTRHFGKLKLGHVGTLDPDADGVLPVLIGRATKLQDYLLDMAKAYSFNLRLGTATDTLDASGQITSHQPWDHVTPEQVPEVVKFFTGEITQVPPLFSAVKYQGKELYKYARSGHSDQDVPLEDLQRRVLINSITVDYCRLPDIGFTVHCSKGTYVRTLGFDIAEKLQTTGHVTQLTRIQSAGFKLGDCITIEQATSPGGSLESILIPFDQIVIGLPAWRADDMFLVRRLIDGQRVIIKTPVSLDVPGSGDFDVLIKSPDDKNIGIVTATLLEGENLKLHMKRGL